MAELKCVVSADEASVTTLGIGDSRITVHCDLGSGTSGNNSLTVRKRQNFACGGIELWSWDWRSRYRRTQFLYVVEAEVLAARIATNLPLGEDTTVVRSSFVALTQSWRS